MLSATLILELLMQVWQELCLPGPVGTSTLQAGVTATLVARVERGMGALYIKTYLVHRELYHLVQYTCPIVLPLISGL